MHDVIAAEPGEARLRWVGEDGVAHALPSWASWLISVGASAGRTNDPEVTFWLVISLPDRRYASALLAHGAVTERARTRALPPVTARFTDALAGDGLTWIDSNGHSRYGRFRGIEADRIVYEPRVHGGWGVLTSRLLTHAESFWPSVDLECFVGGRAVASSPDFVEVATGLARDHFLAASAIEVTVVGTRTELDRDLTDQPFRIGEASGTLKDVVRPRHLCEAGQHWRSVVVPSSSDSADARSESPDAPTIFDGPSAYLRLRDQVRGPVNVVVLDRWHPRSADAAAMARVERSETWVEHDLLRLPEAPPSVEVFAWAAER